MLLNFLGRIGVVAGKTAGEWMKLAAEWAAKGGHGANVIDCCRNAAKATFGSDAPPGAIRKLADTLCTNSKNNQSPLDVFREILAQEYGVQSVYELQKKI